MCYAVVWQRVMSRYGVCAVCCVLCRVTLVRLKCKLPDDGRRPKHVGAILICFNVNFRVF
jgi:hypothetical protein